MKTEWWGLESKCRIIAWKTQVELSLMSSRWSTHSVSFTCFLTKLRKEKIVKKEYMLNRVSFIWLWKIVFFLMQNSSDLLVRLAVKPVFANEFVPWIFSVHWVFCLLVSLFCNYVLHGVNCFYFVMRLVIYQQGSCMSIFCGWLHGVLLTPPSFFQHSV